LLRCRDICSIVKLIAHGDLLGGKIIAVGGNPVIYRIDHIAYLAKLFLSLVYPWGSNKDRGVVEDNAVRLYPIRFDHCFLRIRPDEAYKMLDLVLPLIKVCMALVVPIHNADLSG